MIGNHDKPCASSLTAGKNTFIEEKRKLEVLLSQTAHDFPLNESLPGKKRSLSPSYSSLLSS